MLWKTEVMLRWVGQPVPGRRQLIDQSSAIQTRQWLSYSSCCCFVFAEMARLQEVQCLGS